MTFTRWLNTAFPGHVIQIETPSVSVAPSIKAVISFGIIGSALIGHDIILDSEFGKGRQSIINALTDTLIIEGGINVSAQPTADGCRFIAGVIGEVTRGPLGPLGSFSAFGEKITHVMPALVLVPEGHQIINFGLVEIGNVAIVNGHAMSLLLITINTNISIFSQALFCFVMVEGRLRATGMLPERRKEIAQKAAKARWEK